MALPLARHDAGDGDTTGGCSQLKPARHVRDLGVSILSDPRGAHISGQRQEKFKGLCVMQSNQFGIRLATSPHSAGVDHCHSHPVAGASLEPRQGHLSLRRLDTAIPGKLALQQGKSTIFTYSHASTHGDHYQPLNRIIMHTIHSMVTLIAHNTAHLE